MSEQDNPRPGKENDPQPTQPKIWAGSLSDYNAGRLHGRWIPAAQSPDELLAAISEMLASSPTSGAEEWGIFDYEGFGPVRLGEYESIETISNIAKGIDYFGSAFAAWASHVGIHEEEELLRFTDCYIGRYDSVEDYVDGFLDDLGVQRAVEEAAGSFAPYVRIDVEGLGRDLVIGGDIISTEAPGGGVYLFEP